MNPRTGQLRIEMLDATANASQNWAINARASELFHQRMIAFVPPSVSKATTKIALLDGINVDIVDMQGQPLPAGVIQAGPPCWFMYDADISKFKLCFGGTGNYFDTVPIFTVLWWPNRASLPTGYVAADGQIGDRAVTPSVWEGVANGVVPSVSDAAWLADPYKRGCYSLGDGLTTFRYPDYNGKSSGAAGAPFLRGDGVNSAGAAGTIQGDAIRNITGSFVSDCISVAPMGQESGAIASSTSNTFNLHTGTSANQLRSYTLDASRVVPTANENRPINVTGCYIIKVYGSVANAGIIDAAALDASKASRAEVYGRGGDSGVFSFRNKIINGCFRFWQRGNTQSTPGYGSVDRFRLSIGSGSLVLSMGDQADVLPGMVNGRYGLLAGTNLVDGAITQPIEDVRTLAGKRVTFSWYSRVVSGSLDAGAARPYLRQYFGTGGSATVDIAGSTPVETIIAGGGIKRTSITFQVPSCWGKPIGANSSLIAVMPLQGTFLMSTWGWQLEEGNVASEFEQRPSGVELALCQRYFCTFTAAAAGAYPTASGAVAKGAFYFPVPMRTAPTLFNGTVTFGNNVGSWDIGALHAPTDKGGILSLIQGAGAGNFNIVVSGCFALAEL